MTTPLQISMVLHYWKFSDDFPGVENEDTYQQIEALVESGILVRVGDHRRFARNHEAMEAYINALCAVPFPVKKWVMP